MMANIRNNTTGTSSAYSTISTSEMALNNTGRAKSNQGSRRSASPANNVSAIYGNSRPSFARSRSCDLIIGGKAIQPTLHLPPPSHLRHKFTTLAALGTKPTTKPLPFSFSVSTVCQDGSCRRYLDKKQRYAKCYEETFENVVTQHARIARNLDKLAVKVRKIFNEPSQTNCCRHRQRSRYNPLNYTTTDDPAASLLMMDDDDQTWDLGELVKNADILSRNLQVSSRILNELIKVRGEMASLNISNDDAVVVSGNDNNNKDDINKASQNQHLLEDQLSTIKIISAKLEQERQKLKSQGSVTSNHHHQQQDQEEENK